MTRHNFRTLDWVLIENSLGSNGLFLARDGKQRTLMAGQDSLITSYDWYASSRVFFSFPAAKSSFCLLIGRQTHEKPK